MLKNTHTLSDALRLSGPLRFNMMFKPVGAMCNLGCSYCYYLDKVRFYDEHSYLPLDLLEKVIKEYIEINDKINEIINGINILQIFNFKKKTINEFNLKSEAVNEISKSAVNYINTAISGLDEKVATLTVMFKQQENNFYEYCNKVSENTVQRKNNGLS